MPVRTARAVWTGNLVRGKGTVSVESGLFDAAPYNFRSRFEQGAETNPEELIGAAHAGCFSMALSDMLASDGHTPNSVETVAKVHLTKVGDGFRITLIELETVGDVPGIDAATFQSYAERAKTGCPVSNALASVKIELKATFKG
ncbi:MAG: OsmC family protein [Anaerolineae bacterium]|nr:OsmC family protein [Anaerolineae bacterium]